MSTSLQTGKLILDYDGSEKELTYSTICKTDCTENFGTSGASTGSSTTLTMNAMEVGELTFVAAGVTNVGSEYQTTLKFPASGQYKCIYILNNGTWQGPDKRTVSGGGSHQCWDVNGNQSRFYAILRIS